MKIVLYYDLVNEFFPLKSFNYKVATFLPVLILRVLSDKTSFKREELCYVVENGEYDNHRDVSPALTHTPLQ